MTDKIHDQISAFIDDELMDEESQLLVRRLCNDQSLRQTAARYTLIGDAVRGSLDEIRADLNGNIMRAIEAEQLPDVALVPAPPASSLWRLAGGGAVAAAVAALAVLAISPANDTQSVPNLTASAQESVVVPPDRPPSNPLVGSTGPLVQRASNQSQLQSYLLRHKQYSKTTMGQGILVYSTITTDDTQAQQAVVTDADALRVKSAPKQ